MVYDPRTRKDISIRTSYVIRATSRRKDNPHFGWGRNTGNVHVSASWWQHHVQTIFPDTIKRRISETELTTPNSGVQAPDLMYWSGVKSWVESKLLEILWNDGVHRHGGNDLTSLGINQSDLEASNVETSNAQSLWDRNGGFIGLACHGASWCNGELLKREGDLRISLPDMHSPERDIRLTLHIYREFHQLNQLLGIVVTGDELRQVLQDSNYEKWVKHYGLKEWL